MTVRFSCERGNATDATEESDAPKGTLTMRRLGMLVRHHLRLDLRDTEPGAYVLGVRIQNAETRGYSLPAVTDILVRET